MSKGKNNKEKIAPIIFTIIMILISTIYIGGFVVAAFLDTVAITFAVLGIIVYLAVCVGIILALKDRINEINGGEENEARKY